MKRTLPPTWALLLILALVAGAVFWGGATYADSQRAGADRNAKRVATAAATKLARHLATAAADEQHRQLVAQYRSLVKGCGRGNILRRQGNTLARVQLAFLEGAITARIAAVQTATTDADRKLNADAARKYTHLLTLIHSVPIVDCQHAYANPDASKVPA